MKQFTTILSIIFIINLTGCSKNFLEIDPKGRILAKEITDYRNLFYNNTLLSNGIDADVHLILGDDVTALSNYLTTAPIYAQRGFSWQPDLYNDDQDAGEFTRLMSQIYLLNKIIVEVENSDGGTMEEKLELKAEARASRAWSYFMLINYYGKPYNTATADKDPGFPIVEEADASATSFRRSSVQKVYDFIIKDLKESIPLLPYNTDVRTRMTLSAAEALLGKTYLFMSRFSDALSSFNQAFSHLPTSFEVGLYDYNSTMIQGGTWYFSPTVNSYIGGPLPWASQESLFSRQILTSWVYSSNVLIMNKETTNLFNEGDKRKLLFTRKPSQALVGTEYPVPNIFRKYAPSNAASYGITMPDLYLMRSECEARIGNVDNALSDLNILRKKRTSEPPITIRDRNTLTRFIIDERRREFALQGFRWFDMRRLSVDPLFSSNVYTHILYDQDGNEVEHYKLSAERLTLRLPKKVLLFNPGMDENP
jgi:tetratricopeptide (TPR) repeat protein